MILKHFSDKLRSSFISISLTMLKMMWN